MLFISVNFDGYVAPVVLDRAAEKPKRIEIRTRRMLVRGAYDNLVGIEFKRHRDGIFCVFFGRKGFPFKQYHAFVDFAAAFQLFEHRVGFGDFRFGIGASARKNNLFWRILFIKFFGKVQTLPRKRGQSAVIVHSVSENNRNYHQLFFNLVRSVGDFVRRRFLFKNFIRCFRIGRC